jgi:hypothetical protein
MARPIKILSINFPFKSPDVIQENTISKLTEWEDCQRLSEEYRRKHEDLARLLNGALVERLRGRW